MARLLVGVSGGIAAYKALELTRLAIGAGHAVRVIQTPASLRFVGRESFAAITGAPVLVSQFEPDPARGAYPGEPPPEHRPISHLALVERADAYLIAPASANTIAKLAHGLADNLLSTAALAAACPVALAPAMNNRMWLAPATQDNVQLLRTRGVTVLEPATGALASHGEQGIGRLPEPAELLEAVERLIAPPGDMRGLRVLISAGGTREPIDQVRYIGNRSSGRMGYALARVAARRGAQVTLIAANVALAPPPGVEVVAVGTAAELARACRERFGACDVLLMAAAVADFRAARPFAGKLKKRDGTPATLTLEPTEDILAALAAERQAHQLLVGFAAEHGPRALELAREKLTAKALDALVVNDVSRPEIGFDSEENEVTILLASGEEHAVARRPKDQVAEEVLDAVAALWRDGRAGRAARPDGEQSDGADRADLRPACA